MPFELENLKMPQILRISDEITILVAVDVKSREIVLATGTGGFEDFNERGYVSLPIEAVRKVPEFLQDFLTSWDTSRAAERVKRILEVGETTRRTGNEVTLVRKTKTSIGSDRNLEGHCAICGREVATESTTGWFKLHREGRVIWICPDHDSREALLFAQS